MIDEQHVTHSGVIPFHNARESRPDCPWCRIAELEQRLERTARFEKENLHQTPRFWWEKAESLQARLDALEEAARPVVEAMRTVKREHVTGWQYCDDFPPLVAPRIEALERALPDVEK